MYRGIVFKMKTTLFYNGKILVYKDTLPYRGNCNRNSNGDAFKSNNYKNYKSMSCASIADENCLKYSYFVDSMIVSGKKILKLGEKDSLRI